MARMPVEKENDEEIQFTCFYLSENLCGLDIRRVQEINDELDITPVPLSPAFVIGIMNLRGQIITVIDQSMKIGLGQSTLNENSRVIIVQAKQDFVGLIVDRLAEVVTVRKSRISKPPSNVKGIQGSFFYGVVHTEKNELLGLLNLDTLMSDE